MEEIFNRKTTQFAAGNHNASTAAFILWNGTGQFNIRDDCVPSLVKVKIQVQKKIKWPLVSSFQSFCEASFNNHLILRNQVGQEWLSLSSKGKYAFCLWILTSITDIIWCLVLLLWIIRIWILSWIIRSNAVQKVQKTRVR